jgi:hypothetical protein
MTEHRLVTDEQAENIRAVLDMGGLINAHGYELLATRAACVEKLAAVNRVLNTDDDDDFWAVVRSIAPFLAELHGTEKP